MKNFALIVFFVVANISLAYSTSNRHSPARSVKQVLKSVKAVTNGFNKLEYNFSSSAIRPCYLPEIDYLEKTIVAGNYAFALWGYYDSTGNYTANWHLSKKRFNVLKEYLIKKGVGDNHITTTAFGSTKPVSTNKKALDIQYNRCVEIQLNEI